MTESTTPPHTVPGDRSAAADVPATLTRVHMIGIGGAGMSAVARILLDHLSDIMTRVRDHMRAQPPRSAASRRRRPGDG